MFRKITRACRVYFYSTPYSKLFRMNYERLFLRLYNKASCSAPSETKDSVNLAQTGL